MNKIAFVFVCLMGAAVLAPSASAAEVTSATSEAALVDEAPIEAAISQDCRRRPGRMSFMRSCVSVDSAAVGGPTLSEGCARRVAYRGHRRVTLPLRSCRPMFGTDRSDA
jgi:hypothetical protein